MQEVVGYRLERRFLSMSEYALKAARQVQQGAGVATTAALQPHPWQRIVRSQLFELASWQVTAFTPGSLNSCW